jgi:hypothetical protein
MASPKRPRLRFRVKRFDPKRGADFSRKTSLEKRLQIVANFQTNGFHVLQWKALPGMIRMEVDPRLSYRINTVQSKIEKMGFDGVQAFIMAGDNRVQVKDPRKWEDEEVDRRNMAIFGNAISRSDLDYPEKSVKKKQGRIKSVFFFDTDDQFICAFHAALLRRGPRYSSHHVSRAWFDFALHPVSEAAARYFAEAKSVRKPLMLKPKQGELF